MYEAPGRLLVVDDIADNREVLKRRFQRLGYDVAEADGGRRALELIEQEHFDLILLDIVMPEMDGLEVLRRIRLVHSPEALPVVMVTARATSDDVAGALDLGANDYITKPVDLAVAKARVAVQIGRKRAEDASRDAHRRLEVNVESLRAAVQAAEAAAKAKSDFLANMSHEIRTPLNGILGVASVLRDDCEKPAHKEMVQIIEDSARSLERLLSDVLDTARMEAGKLEIRNEPFNLADLVEGATKLFEASAAQKGLALSVDIAPEARRRVYGDPGRLQQIVTNLMSNAVKFTAEGVIRCAVRPDDDADRFILEVRDTGIGFEPQLADAVFERFRQADSAITRRYGGSGLGLAISRDLAELLGGTLTAESAPGVGSTFRLSIPLPAEDAAGRLQAARVAASEVRRIRVLAADDNEVNRRVVELILSAETFEVVCVENGAEAVAAAARAEFDVILMDIQMPVMDGLTAIQEIRSQAQDRGFQPAPILALSANTDPADVARSVAAGAEQHVGKPISAAVLLAAVGRALDPSSSPCPVSAPIDAARMATG